MAEGLAGGEGFAVDASLIVADVHRQCGVAMVEDLPQAGRSVDEYLAVLNSDGVGRQQIRVPPDIAAKRFQLSSRA